MAPDRPPSRVLAELRRRLPGGGEDRPGQEAMADAVGSALASGRHLIVQAGTGTGKSLAYLVPVVLEGRPTVVATATKALQDQLAQRDLPFLGEHVDVEWAVLKGRSNYLCLQRLREVQVGTDGRLELDDDLAPAVRAEVRRLAAWAAETATGDRAELPWNPGERAWEAVSVTAEQCPGAARCPLGEPCFAEAARRRAGAAQVVVVNLHLYGTHLASGGGVLPPHDLLVVDEAHQLEDIISATAGLVVSAGRFVALARTVRAVIADDTLVGNLAGAGSELTAVLADELGRRVPAPVPDPIARAIAAGRQRVDTALGALRAVTTDVTDANQRKIRAQKAATTLADDLDAALRLGDRHVAWVEGPAHNPRLTVAPLEVGPLLAGGVWQHVTAVLTSATIPTGLAARVGLPEERTDHLDVGSPFDYKANAALYCAAHLPPPNDARFEAAAHDELAALITAAGGRTLALFTSRRAMEAAAAALRPRLAHPILVQDDLPKPALVDAFRRDEATCLFGTAGLFQGIDVPGTTLSLVAIDRIPFPRPDDPLLSARRNLAGAAAFRTIDLPRAATLLAQAAGRLIRTADDRGVVAVLDRRLARARYGPDLVAALPPLRRTTRRADVLALLERLAAAAER